MALITALSTVERLLNTPTTVELATLMKNTISLLQIVEQ